MRRLIAPALVALALLPPGGAESALRTGLYGIVMRGPTRPVCLVDVPCTEPAQVTLVFWRSGREAARTRSGADGRYRIALAPGSYSVTTTLKTLDHVPRPSRVRVPKRRYARVDFALDTGIRAAIGRPV